MIVSVSSVAVRTLIPNGSLGVSPVCVATRRASLTVGVMWRAGRPRGLAQAGRRVRRPPLLPCCQEYLHVSSTTLPLTPLLYRYFLTHKGDSKSFGFSVRWFLIRTGWLDTDMEGVA